MTLKIPLTAAGASQLRDSQRARACSVTAKSRNTTRAKLRAKRALSR